MSAKDDALKKAYDFAEAREIDKAWKIVKRYLDDEPNDPNVLTKAAFIYEKIGDDGLAYHLYRRAAEVCPNDSGSWLNFGRAAQNIWRTAEAESAYKRGLTCSFRTEAKKELYGNLSALWIDCGDYKQGEFYARKALEFDPTMKGGLTNVGFCQMAQGNWAEGWANYKNCIGTDWRKKCDYKGEPEWQGEADKTVVLYGEQGIGDEICFASMLPDMAKRSKKVILDTDHRLANLFRRSFPQIKVYGTRFAKDGMWDKADHEFDCSYPLGQIGEFLRTDANMFHVEPYLVADPERVTMWKALWGAKGKPAIGIAWSGGTGKTGAKFRFAALKEWLPLLKSVDAHFVSLQYRPAAAEIKAFKDEYGIEIAEYPYATQTADYDDTAALVASLDAVISVPTAVVHLAGALGVPTYALSAKMKCWKYHAGIPFHPVNMIEWAGSWPDTIKAVIPCLTSSKSSSVLTHANPSPTTSCKPPSTSIAVNQ